MAVERAFESGPSQGVGRWRGQGDGHSGGRHRAGPKDKQPVLTLPQTGAVFAHDLGALLEQDDGAVVGIDVGRHHAGDVTGRGRIQRGEQNAGNGRAGQDEEIAIADRPGFGAPQGGPQPKLVKLRGVTAGLAVR